MKVVIEPMENGWLIKQYIPPGIVCKTWEEVMSWLESNNPEQAYLKALTVKPWKSPFQSQENQADEKQPVQQSV